MAIDNGYLSLAELKGWINIDDNDDDTELEQAIEAASRGIDHHCNREGLGFYQSDAQTRYFTPSSDGLVRVDDLRTVTTLKTDSSGDGTFDVTWTSSQYRLEPLNAAADGRPYTRVRRSYTGGRSFSPTIPRSVEIVGDWGWEAVPELVKQACVHLSHRLLRSGKDAPLGIVHLPGIEGTGGMRVPKVDAVAAALLTHYVRTPVLVG